MWQADPHRYDSMIYRRVGRSGLKLPVLSLGLWHNFGGVDSEVKARKMIQMAFDAGVTHFDLANNYGPPPGSAESTFGRILATDLKAHRDECIISTKAGWTMWPGPYGDWGSRKYLIASCDQSLKRMGLEYVDIFYSHRPDPATPIAETMGALDSLVRAGKALYVGLSSYSPEQTKEAVEVLQALGTPCLIHQPRYNMIMRGIEDGLMDVLESQGMGCIGFSPLAQGLLAGRYLEGVPDDSRIARPEGYLKTEHLEWISAGKIKALQLLAQSRGQTLAQMSIAWCLRDSRMSSVIVGASRPEQLQESLKAIQNLDFTVDELSHIDQILSQDS
jgi:L-glyceraldehyde 3-phosphate reductase